MGNLGLKEQTAKNFGKGFGCGCANSPIQEQNVPLNPGMFRSPSRPCCSGGSFLKLSVSSAHSWFGANITMFLDAVSES